ncbi:MAG: type II toxin-antitoxin system Phd/YefM family antitoxin [Hyphomicrobiales bacterium]
MGGTMSHSTWSVQDAKNRFSSVVEAARREPQTVTKHGKPTVVVVAAEEFARLQHLQKQEAKSFVDHLLAMPKDDGSFDRIDAELRDTDF